MVKITDTQKSGQVGKSKKSSKSKNTSGVHFDQFIEAAQEASALDEVLDVAGSSFVEGISSEAERSTGFTVPEKAKERGAYILDVLEDLEKDILSGNKSVAVEKLRQALETKAIDVQDIPSQLKDILDEIELRAALEVAKVEESSK